MFKKVIKPALENNMVVVCDRYVDSIWHARVRPLGDVSQVKAINEAAVEGVWPDLTILLDVEPEVGLRRHRQEASAAGRPSCSCRAGGLDRIEQRDLEFHQRVRDGYHVLSTLYAQRFVVIDTTGLEIETVAQKVWEAVEQRFKGDNR